MDDTKTITITAGMCNSRNLEKGELSLNPKYITEINKQGLFEMVIPEQIDGKEIISITENAFDECKSLRSVTIPNTVKSIGFNAFRYCTNIENIALPDSLTIISGGAFYGCDNLKSIDMPAVRVINGWSFSGCKNLKAIEIPNTINTISHNAFVGCEGLEILFLGTESRLNELLTENFKNNIAKYHINVQSTEVVDKWLNDMINKSNCDISIINNPLYKKYILKKIDNIVIKEIDLNKKLKLLNIRESINKQDIYTKNSEIER